ncbi:MAG: class I SAM-dependent RNA methyltransferase, partial [Clostridia bacterium]|nr:class I SAM-dependent RNA methyltransferase [Clostridia bacterium]
EYRILDAYCGAGTITLAAARRAAHAVGVEIVPPAIENAKKNAQTNGLQNKTRFICADAAKEIPKLMARGERFDAVIVDPPRKGCDQALLDALANAKITRISYVSCNPSTLARDVKILAERGYRLEWAQPVDMFPWTEHVECVAYLTR